MNNWLLLTPIFLPLATGGLALLLRKQPRACAWLCAVSTIVQLLAAGVCFGRNWAVAWPWGAFGLEFALKLSYFSGFIVLATSIFAFLFALYATAFMRGRPFLSQFYSYFLITVGLVNGAVLADNLIVLIFFWEGLLLTLFGMIIIGRAGGLAEAGGFLPAGKTAVKALIISGVADLCLMVGIGMTIYLAGTASMSRIHLAVGGWHSVAFIFLMIGTCAKAGAMPFHSWIPDAAVDAPLPFMALMPGCLEKLLGIYFLARVTLDLYALNPASLLSPALMVLGCVTILLAVLMALVQKDYKRLLAFHAISQVGYMILGIGTCVPAGIVGGLFHMLNNAMYKSCLFLTGGAVEKEAGTTDLAKLGGLGKQMPVTCFCFLLTAAAISGVPPFNGFFSKELVYDGALLRGWGYYAAALLGSFFTAASFLKLGHSAYFGKLAPANAKVREAPAVMLAPMLVIAGLCLVFGVWNSLPIEGLIQPGLNPTLLEGHTFAGFPKEMLLVILTAAVLVGALLNHLWGVRRAGSGLGAVDHIHYAPGLHALYDQAERRVFDPYEIGLKIAGAIARLAWGIDRGIDFLYDVVAVKITYAFTDSIRSVHTGSLLAYLSWALVGLLLVLILIMGGI